MRFQTSELIQEKATPRIKTKSDFNCLKGTLVILS